MKNPNSLLRALLIGALGAGPARGATFRPQSAPTGSVPQGISYQGRLMNNGGPASGAYNFVFYVYDAATGGSRICQDGSVVVSPTPGQCGLISTANLDSGLFSLTIPLSAAALMGNGQRWLQVEIDGGGASPGNGTLLSPREQLNAVPYALVAKTVEGTIDISTGGFSVIPNSSASNAALFVSSSTGRVGIGTSAPGYQLDVQGGDINASGNLREAGTTLASKYLSSAVPYNDPAWLTGLAAAKINPGSFANGAYTFANAVNFPNSGIWNASGNLGVGTASPATALDVNGGSTIRQQETVVGTATVQGNAFSVGGNVLAVAGGNLQLLNPLRSTYGGTGVDTSGAAAGRLLISQGGSPATWAAQAMSNDATITNAGVLTLANTAVSAGTYGGASSVPQITVDAKGRVTGVTPVSISIGGAASLADDNIWIGNLVGNAMPHSLSGDITMSDTGVTTLATVLGSPGSFGSATQIPSFTVNGKGLITAAASNAITGVGTLTAGTWNANAIGVGYGGTGLSNPTAHSILVGNGAGNVTQLGVGPSNQVLQGNAGADPSWTGSPNISIGGNAATVTNGVYTSGSYGNPGWITSLAAGKITAGALQLATISKNSSPASADLIYVCSDCTTAKLVFSTGTAAGQWADAMGNTP